MIEIHQWVFVCHKFLDLCQHQMAEFRQMHILANYNYRIFSFSLSAGSSSIYIWVPLDL